jgi:CSLREA domain-containing protein
MKPFFRITIAAAVLGSLALRTHPDISYTFTVTTALDNDADGCGEPPADQCTLREAIDAANAHVGILDTIEFNIPGGGVQTIAPTSARLSRIDDPVHIDGYSQPGASEAPEDGVAQLMIQLDGSGLGISAANHGLFLASAGSTIEGLSIYGFPGSGIYIDSRAWLPANNNTIRGNHIGVNWNATSSPTSNSYNGVFIGGGATGNVIGGDLPADRNVISGNDWSGVEIWATGTSGNTVTGNRIGTNGAASNVIANQMHGVRIYGGATLNTIGGDNTVGPLGQCGGECNVISGNTMCGVMIYGVTQPTASTTVTGNYIGLNLLGGVAIPNGDSGVCITDSASNVIGGDIAGERNLISGNLEHGVYITGSLASLNTVKGNYIGLKRDGLTANPNTYRGVAMRSGAHANTIGGTAPGQGNVISGNDASGLLIDDAGTDDNSILGNLIGTDFTGTLAVPNGMHGIEVYGGDNTIVGGEAAGARNVISGNTNYALNIGGADVSNVTVAGNLIGVDATGLLSLPNLSGGVSVNSGVSGVLIGGDTIAEGNVISGNDGSGVSVMDSSTGPVTLRGNWIGMDRSATRALSNTQAGVEFLNGASIHTLGPDNVIAHNGAKGVYITADCDQITITRNRIFANATDEISIWVGANGGIQAPTIDATSLGSVNIIGTACLNCTVEVFGSNTHHIGAERYLGTATADGILGAWNLTLPGLAYPYLTATATDSLGNTSALASDFVATVRSLFLPLVLRQFP